MSMVSFVESKMLFSFDSDSVYRIEKSDLLNKVGNMSSCKCLVDIDKKIVLIEAKSSAPKSESKDDFDRFINEVARKFSDTLLFFNAVRPRHEEEPIGENLSGAKLQTCGYSMYLIIHGHHEEWLQPLLDALKKQLKGTLRLWRISDISVKVINEQKALQLNLIQQTEIE